MPVVSQALIIDDDEVNNFICVRQIRAANFAGKAEFLLNGREALDELGRRIKEDPDSLPDLIFLDINMPVMDAWEFLDEYERLHMTFSKPVKLFILSSSIYRKHILKASKYPSVVDYYFKPLSKELLARVAEKHFPSSNP